MSKPYILCVDDDKSILISLKAQLRHCLGDAFNYEIAECAEEALDVIEDLRTKNKHLAVIISDWVMPRIKGDEFLIGVHQDYPEIIKIMLTGQADPRAVKRAVEQANLSACLEKPWNIDELISVIKAELVVQ